MRRIVFLFSSLLVLSCSEQQQVNKNKQEKELEKMNNPLLKKSELPYGAPNFNSFKASDFSEAFIQGMSLQRNRVEEIIQNSAPADFENTIIALEKSGVELRRVMQLFYALTGAHTNDTLKAIQKEMQPKFAAHQDFIYLSEPLFERVKTVYQHLEHTNITGEDRKLVEYYYENFVISGANLSSENKSKLKEINTTIASLTNEFNQSLQEANKENALILYKENELEGLSPEQKATLLQADGSWKIPLINTTEQPLLSSLVDENTRKALFEKSWERASKGEYKTTDLIIQIAKKRAEKAQLLSYDNYADWSLQQTMIKKTENVRTFFDKLIPSTVVAAKKEAEKLEKLKGSTLYPWDWAFYSEKLRKEEYNLNEEELKPYFELWNVLEKGVFYVAEQLYGITFKKRTDIPVYHPDVAVYELFEENGDALGLFYADFFARESKRGGAWMSNFVTQSKLLGQKPVIYNVCNYTKPSAGQAALLSFDEVTTMFHEFGHALHGFFAQQQYASLSGTAVARDFVEFPSQINEYWALYPQVLKNYAIHYQTQEVIPAELIAKMKKSSNFNQGFAFTEVLAAAYLDLQWHSLSLENIPTDVFTFEAEVLKDFPTSVVPPRYRSPYFAHIFGGGYAAGYYAYQYTEMLAHDGAAWFEENGGLTRENGNRLRELILSKGNTKDYEQMYHTFRGSMPQGESILKARGINKIN